MAGGTTLEYTPTWVVAFVCSVIVFISLVVERLLHYTGKYLKRKNQKPLFEALQKIKEELMLLGFISLLLTVLQGPIEKICISEKLASHWLPCKKESKSTSTTAHFQTSSFFSSNYYSRQLLVFPAGTARRLLADDAETSESGPTGSCPEGKVSLLSTTALHHLHIFIFVLAVVHVTFCVLTIIFGGIKIRQWKQWEDSIVRKEYNPEEVLTQKFTAVQDHDFIRGRFLGIGKNLAFLGWLIAYFKQFYGSVTKTDYMTMRLGFIKTHCKGNPNFNFHKYMVRALEADFKKVVGIRSVAIFTNNLTSWIYIYIYIYRGPITGRTSTLQQLSGGSDDAGLAGQRLEASQIASRQRSRSEEIKAECSRQRLHLQLQGSGQRCNLVASDSTRLQTGPSDKRRGAVAASAEQKH